MAFPEISIGQYQGSQAFAHVIPGQDESVNPNTGSLNFRKALVELRGIRGSVDLNLSVSYAAGTAGTFGLPRNWTLNLPYVIPDKTVTFSGRTYVIDMSWTDNTGYSSGLKYINNHGIEFSPTTTPLPLPFGGDDKREYSYRLKVQDGSCSYFDASGRPIACGDIFGNSLRYYYLDGTHGDVLTPQPCLDYIMDSWNQRITFSYNLGSEMIIAGPTDVRVSIQLSTEGISLITDPMDYETRFTYAQEGPLSKIEYATGLVSKFEYTTIRFLDKDAIPGHLPVVRDHYRYDSQNHMLSRTKYQFGSEPAQNTFTGIGIGCRLGRLEDELMESGNLSYTYDVAKMAMDEAGKLLSKTLTWFNYLHLPIIETKYLVDIRGSAMPTYQTKYHYQIDPNLHARTSNYSQPDLVEISNNRAVRGEPNWQSLRRNTTRYTPYGKVVSSNEEIFEHGQNPLMTRTIFREYFETSFRTQILRLETVTDLLAGTMRETQNMLSDDGKSIAVSTSSFQTAPEADIIPWKKHTFEYDPRGRTTLTKVAWAEGSPVPEGSAESYFSSTAYSFQDGILAEFESDSATGTTSKYYDMRIMSGPNIRTTLPLGETESYEYDKIGRLVKYTDALGSSTTTVHSVGASLNAETATNALGFIQQTKFDAMGRPIEESDNGDPTQPLPEPTRILKSMVYDAQGLLSVEKDYLGLSTFKKYDALGRLVESTDPFNNVSHIMYDDSQLMERETLNGDLRVDKTVNGFGQTVREARYADSGDSSITYCLVQETRYNGIGQKSREILRTDAINGSQASNEILKTQTTLYDAESRVTNQIITAVGDTGEDTVTRSFTYDLQGYMHTWFKATTYADGTNFACEGPVTLYDMRGNITLYRNQLGDEEHNTYDQNGWHISTRRFDGTELSHTYDDCGRLVQTRSDSGEINIAYDEEGQVTSIKQQDANVYYKYCLDGSQSSIKYGEEHIQMYERDGWSRVTSFTDGFRTVKKTQFDRFGRIASVSCQGDVISFTYDEVNHAAGSFVGYSLTGLKPHVQSIKYDGFGRKCMVQEVGPDSGVLLKTVYSMNNRGQMSSTTCTSSVQPRLEKTHSWTYDGIGQVKEESVVDSGGKKTTSTFTYDGNSNIISTTADGRSTNITYNKIDQRTDSGFEYDKNGRMTRDGAGAKYVFNDFDRLKEVEMPDGRLGQYRYHGNNLLATIDRPEETVNFFYTHDKKVNAVDVSRPGQASQQSSLLRAADNIIATYSASSGPTYFFEKLGSTALQVSGEESTAMEYQAYGSMTSTSPLKAEASFGFGQEVVDSLSGLVYLQSRYYHPGHMAFISMDSYHVENRYAYCHGDPVNFFDPSGHTEAGISWLAALASAAVGSLFTTVVQEATGIILAFFGAEEAALDDPALANAAAANPAVADPAVADPAVANPAVADPAVANPAVANSRLTLARNMIAAAAGGSSGIVALDAIMHNTGHLGADAGRGAFGGALTVLGMRLWRKLGRRLGPGWQATALREGARTRGRNLQRRSVNVWRSIQHHSRRARNWYEGWLDRNASAWPDRGQVGGERQVAVAADVEFEMPIDLSRPGGGGGGRNAGGAAIPALIE